MAKELVRLKAPEGCTSVSFAGEEYTVAKDGHAKVPAEAAADLIAGHGFAPAEVQQAGASAGRAAANTQAPAATQQPAQAPTWQQPNQQ